MSENMRRYTSEFIGTFFLVFAGCGAVGVESVNPGTLGHPGISMVFGLIVMVLIYAVGNISGAHFNPAVTMGFFWARRITFRQVPPYLAAQISGAVLASLLLKAVLPAAASVGATLPSAGVWQSLLLETVFTFLLMFVILNVSTGHMEKGIMAGVAVGGTIALLALIGGPLTGASMNPARSLGPALAGGIWQQHWIYWIGPLLGSLAASPWCRYIQGPACCYVDPDQPS